MRSGTTIDESRIVVGKPLPFAIFSGAGKLLLAQGEIVENARMRDMLLQNGRRWEKSGPGGEDGGNHAAREDEAPARPLEQLREDYETSRDSHQLSISMARSEKEKASPVQLIGAHKHCLIVTAPVRPDGSLVAVIQDQTWICRTFQMTSAFRFTAQVSKVAFEPYPHLYLRLMNDVEHRHIRGAPRASVALRAELLVPQPVPCLISDLSTSGARIAVDSTLVTLERGRSARLLADLAVMQSTFQLSIDALVTNAFGPIDSRHPQVAFYGLKFEAAGEKNHLLLHGFVGERLVSELHSLWQMLKPKALGAILSL